MARVVYAIGDVHGAADLLRAGLDAIEAHSAGRDAKLVFLGDYVDRGPHSRAVVEALIALQRIDGRVVCLKGNHEQLMLKALAGQATSGRVWLESGGFETLKSYGANDIMEALEAVPREHLRWMAGLPLTSGDPHRIYVHAGLAPSTPIEKQRAETCLWIREKFLQAKPRQFDRHVVHGHTPIWAGKPDMAAPELLPHRTNLDTGAYLTGVLSIGVFPEDRPGGPAEVLSIRADSADAI